MDSPKRLEENEPRTAAEIHGYLNFYITEVLKFRSTSTASSGSEQSKASMHELENRGAAVLRQIHSLGAQHLAKFVEDRSSVIPAPVTR